MSKCGGKKKKDLVMLVAAGIVLAICAAGCQQVSRVEYYEPTPQNARYCTPSTGAKNGHGPLKCVEGRTGAVDWSDSTTFKFNLSVLGL